jgi:hypothetical protein
MHRRIGILVLAATVIVVTSGSALAAGALITHSDQIAPGVIDGSHVKSNSIPRTDQEHATLRLRVRADGGTFGDAGDATVKRVEPGVYFVTFDRAVIADALATPRNPRWLDDCSVVATLRVGGISSVGTGQDITLATMRGASPGSVIIATAKPDYDLRHPVQVDAPFDLAAIC